MFRAFCHARNRRARSAVVDQLGWVARASRSRRAGRRYRASRGASRPAGQGARAPAVAFAGEPKESRLLRLIFLEGPQPGGPGLDGSQACGREAHGYSPVPPRGMPARVRGARKGE
jgi:hypothetical protein